MLEWIINWIFSWNPYGVPIILLVLWFPVTVGGLIYGIGWELFEQLPHRKRRKEARLKQIRWEIKDLERRAELES